MEDPFERFSLKMDEMATRFEEKVRKSLVDEVKTFTNRLKWLTIFIASVTFFILLFVKK